MRRTRHVSAGTADRASVPRDPRSGSDGKTAKLGYGDEAPQGAHIMPVSGSGEIKLKISRWHGKGDRS